MTSNPRARSIIIPFIPNSKGRYSHLENPLRDVGIEKKKKGSSKNKIKPVQKDRIVVATANEDDIPVDNRNLCLSCGYLQSLRKGKHPLLEVYSYLDSIRDINISPAFLEISRKMLKARLLELQEPLNDLRQTFIRIELLNVVIYDLQVNDIPRPSEDTIIYPDIIQIALYHPLTGKSYSSYVSCSRPITYEVGQCTGIYNSLDLTFDLDGEEYVNLSLLDQPQILDEAVSIRQYTPESTIAASLKSAVEKYVTARDSDSNRRPLVALDHLNRPDKPEKRAPSFSEVAVELIEFLSIGEQEGTLTLLIAHNGAAWCEPILREQFKRCCPIDRLDPRAPNAILFLDAMSLFSSILEDENLDLSRTLGSGRENSFNAMASVLSLWKTLEYIMNAAFGRTDPEFIFGRIAEEIYRRKRQNSF